MIITAGEENHDPQYLEFIAAVKAYSAEHGVPELRKIFQKVCGDDCTAASLVPKAKWDQVIRLLTRDPSASAADTLNAMADAAYGKRK
jgi:hypothetical protein